MCLKRKYDLESRHTSIDSCLSLVTRVMSNRSLYSWGQILSGHIGFYSTHLNGNTNYSKRVKFGLFDFCSSVVGHELFTCRGQICKRTAILSTFDNLPLLLHGSTFFLTKQFWILEFIISLMALNDLPKNRSDFGWLFSQRIPKPFKAFSF